MAKFNKNYAAKSNKFNNAARNEQALQIFIRDLKMNVSFNLEVKGLEINNGKGQIGHLKVAVKASENCPRYCLDLIQAIKSGSFQGSGSGEFEMAIEVSDLKAKEFCLDEFKTTLSSYAEMSEFIASLKGMF